MEERIEVSHIGKLYFDDLPTEDKTVYIEVWDKENKDIPHCHIYNKEKSFDCAICLHKPMYFKHDNHNSEMTPKQLQLFDTFMRNNHDRVYQCTGWEVSSWSLSAESWIGGNPGDIIFPKEQPDYTQVKESCY